MPTRTSGRAHAGRAQAETLIRRYGAELRLARTMHGLTQRRLAELVGVSQSLVSLVERGRRRPAWPTACALASAAGHDLSLRLFPVRAVSLRDSGQFEAVQRILGEAHPSWHPQVEAPIGPNDRRAADLLLLGQAEAIQIEVERSLVDLQAQYRAGQLKREALTQRLGRQVRLVIALPGTRRTRAVLAALQPGIGHILPRSSAAVWRAIRSGGLLGGDGLLILPTDRRV